MNAITYTINDILDYREQTTTKQRLHYRRANLVLGGYVHEAVTVVDRIKGRYLGLPAFESLRVLVVEAEHRKVRRYAKKIRNYLAVQFMGACHEFMLMLWKKKISKHVY